MIDGTALTATIGSSLGTAARNAWAVSWLGPGIEAHRPHPSVLVHDAPHARLSRFHGEGRATAGSPVLLVPPLAVPALCWDLRPGQSLAAALARGEIEVEPGRPAPARATYVVDYGEIGFSDRRMGFEDWFDRILPQTARRVSALHDDAPVHLVGWSLGGTVSLLTAATHPELPLASVTALGTPIDYGVNGSSQPLRWLDRRLGTTAMTAPTALLGGVPAPLVRLTYRALAPGRELRKPLFLLRNLGDAEALARSEAIDRFMAQMPGYPARFYHQLHTRLIVRRELATGRIDFGAGGVVDLANVTVPVTLVGSTSDAIASAAAVRAGVRSLPNATPARYLEVAGLSHLGLIAGTAARSRTWPIVAGQLAAAD